MEIRKVERERERGGWREAEEKSENEAGLSKSRIGRFNYSAD